DARLADSGTQVNDIDERVLVALGVDVRHHGLRSVPRRKQADGSEIDEWGIAYRKEGYYWQIVANPLGEATVADLARYAWPKPEAARVEGLATRARDVFENTGYAIFARSAGAVFQMCCRLRGMDRYLMDMMLDKPFAQALMERATDVTIGLYDSLLGEIGPYVQVVETQDDLGTQRAPFLSPALYRESIQPYHAKLAAFIKQKTSGRAKVFLHSDGSVFDLIPDLIDAGVEVLNPIQPQAAKMEAWRLKQTYGDRLTFHGGLDQQHTIPFGDVAAVWAEVRQKLTVLAPGGGYIFAPCHNLQPDVPPENIVAMFEAGREYGKYPVK
ncbi:MAG: uroporphyrinogen decarboxylase family protein, partial [Chloroflexota bacterium]